MDALRQGEARFVKHGMPPPTPMSALGAFTSPRQRSASPIPVILGSSLPPAAAPPRPGRVPASLGYRSLPSDDNGGDH